MNGRAQIEGEKIYAKKWASERERERIEIFICTSSFVLCVISDFSSVLLFIFFCSFSQFNGSFVAGQLPFDEQKPDKFRKFLFILITQLLYYCLFFDLYSKNCTLKLSRTIETKSNLASCFVRQFFFLVGTNTHRPDEKNRFFPLIMVIYRYLLIYFDFQFAGLVSKSPS